jgi:7,8-dihydro-6-hydroxymethylpterin-pyrophosphokinase
VTRAYVGLGSNLGDRERMLWGAIPRLHERRFVLEPLAELDDELTVPEKGAVQALLARVE